VGGGARVYDRMDASLGCRKGIDDQCRVKLLVLCANPVSMPGRCAGCKSRLYPVFTRRALALMTH